jgi:hypothetical protein
VEGDARLLGEPRSVPSPGTASRGRRGGETLNHLFGIAPAPRQRGIIRKNSFGNRSEQGADVQAILVSIFFTLKKRGHNPIQTICQALTTYLKTGQLPPLPQNTTADG